MAIEFYCSQCQKKLRTADDKAGRNAVCPQCGNQVQVPQVSDEAPPAKVKSSHIPEFEEWTRAAPVPEKTPRAVADVTCPMCGHTNTGGAARCDFCGEELQQGVGGYDDDDARDIGSIWNRAWMLFQKNLGMNIAAVAILWGISFAINFGLSMVVALVRAGLGQGGGDGTLEVITMGFQQIVTWLVTIFSALALTRFALHNQRKPNPELDSLLVPSHRIGTVLLGMLGVGLIMAVLWLPGLVLIGIGAYMVEQAQPEEAALMFMGIGAIWMLISYPLTMACTWPVLFRLVEEDTTATQSISSGVKMATSNFGLSIIMILLHIALMFVGMLMCCIGMLFTYPLSFLVYAVAYDRCLMASRRTGV